MGRKSYEESSSTRDYRFMCPRSLEATFFRMTIAFKLALWIHVLAGAVALSVFWLPLVAKKGGAIHRRVGWVYVAAAATIALTGFVNCARMLTDANPANDRSGVFLAYVGIIAAASAQIGVRALGETWQGPTALKDFMRRIEIAFSNDPLAASQRYEIDQYQSLRRRINYTPDGDIGSFSVGSVQITSPLSYSSRGKVLATYELGLDLEYFALSLFPQLAICPEEEEEENDDDDDDDAFDVASDMDC